MTARKPASGPPKGFRPAIPLRVQVEVILAAFGLTRADVELDHSPPLALRVWDEAARDTIPPANDPAHIVMRLKPAHRTKTSGAPTAATTRGTDIGEIARTRKAAKRQEEFRQRLLAKDRGEKPERKSQWRRQWTRSKSKS